MRVSNSVLFSSAVLSAAVLFGARGGVFADDAKTPAKTVGALETLIPADAVGFLTLKDLRGTIDSFPGSDLHRWVTSHPLYSHVLGTRDVKKGLDHFRRAQSSVGIDLVDLAKDLFGAEVGIGAYLDLGGPRLVAVSRLRDPERVKKKFAVILSGFREGTEDSVRGEVTEYSGYSIETFPFLAYSLVDDVLVLASELSLVEEVIDLRRGKGNGSVATSESFAAAFPAPSGQVRLAVRPKFLPSYRLPTKMGEPLPSLLIGGWLHQLRESDLLQLSLRLDERGVRLSGSTHHGTDGMSERVAPWFPAVSADRIVDSILAESELASFRIGRDLSAWWAAREENLTSRALRGLSDFTQGMTFVFGGRNFEDQVLPEIAAPITFVAAPQDYSSLDAVPQPAIPEFAFVVPLKNPETFGDTLLSSFQSVVGFLRTTMTQNRKDGGYVDMLLKTERVGDRELHYVKISAGESDLSSLLRNFSPSIGTVGRYCVLSSTKALGTRLVSELGGSAHSDAKSSDRSPKNRSTRSSVRAAGDTLRVSGAGVRRALRDNYDLFVAKNMAEKGASKAAAEGEIDTILSVLDVVGDVRFRATNHSDRLGLELRVGLTKSLRKEGATQPTN